MNHNDNNDDAVVDLTTTEVVDVDESKDEVSNGYSMNNSNNDHHHHHQQQQQPKEPQHGSIKIDDDGEIPPDHTESKSLPLGNTSSNNNNNDAYDDDSSSMALRPLFFGNLLLNYSADQITNLFERPELIESLPNQNELQPIYIDRIDIKRGYCFVFLKDATSMSDKRRIEAFCSTISGINVPKISRAIRAEFARGDGRVKRIEDERRKNIAPSETLFVVNFQESTTKKEDLEMLFEPFGKLLRIDLKRNYAFIQYASVAEATAAKMATNGGKLDQSVLTVEYVARQRDRDNNNNNNNRNNNRGGGSNRNHDSRDRDRDRNSSNFINDRGGGGRNNDRMGGGSNVGGGSRYDPLPPYDDRGGRGGGGDIDLRDRGRSEYRGSSSTAVDSYHNRPTIYDNDRYSDRRASRDSPPPPAPSYPYHHHPSTGRSSRSRSPPPLPIHQRRWNPDEDIDRAVRDEYRGGMERRGSGAERRGSGGGGNGSDIYARRPPSPSDRYRVGGSTNYDDRDSRGYR